MLKNVAGQAFRFTLYDSDGDLVTAPTIAAGDFLVDIDGAGQNGVATPPTSDAAGLVTWLPSQAETNGDLISLIGKDVAGDEWKGFSAHFETQLPTSVEAILVDTAEIGVEGGGLTALGDARLANLDATVSSRGTTDPGDAMTLTAAYDAAKTAAQAGDAMALTSAERVTLVAAAWNALVSGFLTVGSIGKRIVDYLNAAVSSRATPADVQVSLAVSETEAATVATGSMALTLYGSFDQTVESDTTEDLSAADALIWAVKADRKRDTDAQALVLVDVAIGLRYLARAAYTGAGTDPTNGSITLGGSSGAWEIRCQLVAGIPGQLATWANKPLDTQIKAIFGDRTVNVWEGAARINHQTVREV